MPTQIESGETPDGDGVRPGSRPRLFKRHRKKTLVAFVLISTLVLDVVLANLLRPWTAQPGDHEIATTSDIYHHDLKPDSSECARWGSVQYELTTNSLGFKDRAIREVVLRTDRHRVVFIGDSFTEGVGFAYDDTYVGMIDAELGQRDIEVLNAAVASYCPLIYDRKVRYLLEDVGLEFDELVVFIDISDAYDEALIYELDSEGNVRMTGYGAAALESFKTGWKNRLKALISRHTILTAAALRFARASLGRTPELKRSMWTFDPSMYEMFGRDGLRNMRRSMDRLRASLGERGIRLTIVVYPWPAQILHRDMDSRQVRIWRDWAERRDVAFLDLFPHFIGDEDPQSVVEKYYIRGDVHFNGAGMSLVARRFLDSWEPDVAP